MSLFPGHDDEQRESRMSRSRRLSQPMPSIIDTRPLRAHRPETAEEEPKERLGGLSRRDLLLRWGSAVAAGAVGLAALSQLPPSQALLASLHQTLAPAPKNSAATATPANSHLPFGYFHAFFEVNTPAEVDQAAALGVNYTITYGDTSWSSADPASPMGKALARNGMKTFLNLEYPFLQCVNGYGSLDLDSVRNLVGKFHSSPLVAGYWIKDDDCGDQSVAIVGFYNLIRSIDGDMSHLIMPGFGDAGSVARNYAHGCADLLGFYPYPAYSRGPAVETPDMLRIVRSRTPAGAQPPPFIGIYQDFATPPARPVLPVSNVLAQVKAYMDNGAAGVAGFGWEAPNETHVVGNDSTLRAAVGATTQWLAQNGYGSPPKH